MSFVKGELPYDKIVDRVRYIDELNQILKNNSGVILIKAATGIGKSSIVTKFLGELDKQQYIIYKLFRLQYHKAYLLVQLCYAQNQM